MLGAQRVELERRAGRVERNVPNAQRGAEPRDEVTISVGTCVTHIVGFAMPVPDEGERRKPLEVLVAEQPRVQSLNEWRTRGAVGKHVDGRERVGHHNDAHAGWDTQAEHEEVDGDGEESEHWD